MTRRLSRITSLALAIAAVAAPSASAKPLTSPQARAHDPAPAPVSIGKVSPDARNVGRPAPTVDLRSPDARDAGLPAPSVDLRSPDARDAARPAPWVDLRSPDVRDNGRREASPIVASAPAPTPVRADGFDWLAAGLGAGGLAALLLVGGTAVARTRRGTLPAA